MHNRAAVNMAELGRYVKSLNPKDREWYLNKLMLVNSERLPHPYWRDPKEWVDDPTKWPMIQWPDIYAYLIEKPSVYTNEKLRAYKSVDAYNYAVCGYVQDVMYSDLN